MALTPSATSANKAKRIVQYEVAQTNLPPIPAALTLAGPINAANIGFPNSAPYRMNGDDSTDPNTGLPCGPNKPAIGTVTDVGQGSQTASQVASAGMADLINAIPSNRTGDYTGAQGCTPDVQNVTQTVPDELTTVEGYNAIVHSVQHAATQSFTGNNPTISNFGTDAAPQVTVVNGDLSISGSSFGAGILLVTGALTLSGNFSFDGMILVIGTGSITMNGGGNGQINGAIVVANIGTSAGCSTGGSNCYATNTNNQSNLLPALGSPIFSWSGGGGNGLRYNSCKIRWSATAGNYNVIARREITY